MAVAVLMVRIEDGVVTLPKWWRKAAAVTPAGLVLATVVLADSGTILTFKGAVPYETLTTICAALLLTLVIPPSAGSSVSFLTRVLETRVLAVVGLAPCNMFQGHEPSSGGCGRAASRCPVRSVS
jgi:hypothetical protein